MFIPPSTYIPAPPTAPREPRMVSIPVTEYVGLVIAARDLNILRDSYMRSAYGIDNAIARAIFGDKPKKEGVAEC